MLLPKIEIRLSGLEPRHRLSRNLSGTTKIKFPKMLRTDTPPPST